MLINCIMCNEQINGTTPRIQLTLTGFHYHTCNKNENGNTCYQEFLQTELDFRQQCYNTPVPPYMKGN